MIVKRTKMFVSELVRNLNIKISAQMLKTHWRCEVSYCKYSYAEVIKGFGLHGGQMAKMRRRTKNAQCLVLSVIASIDISVHASCLLPPLLTHRDKSHLLNKAAITFITGANVLTWCIGQ